MRLDNRFLVHVDGHGDLVFDAWELASHAPKYARRPQEPITVPPRAQGQWAPKQAEALHLFLEKRQNINVTGPPGTGKSEVMGAIALTWFMMGLKLVVLGNANTLKGLRGALRRDLS